MSIKAPASTMIRASFEVTNWNETPFDERTDAAKLTAATVIKTYSGEIEGSSVTEWLMAYADDGSATFVGMERITGTIVDRSGTLVLQHVGSFEDGAAIAELTVVEGCGGGAARRRHGHRRFPGRSGRQGSPPAHLSLSHQRGHVKSGDAGAEPSGRAGAARHTTCQLRPTSHSFGSM